MSSVEKLGIDLNETASRIGLIAGYGTLPMFVAERLAASGQEPFIVMLEGDADPALAQFDHIIINTASVKKLVTGLREAGVKRVAMIGGVKSRPAFQQFRPDLMTLRMVGRIARALRAGDDAILRGVIGMLEEAGFEVIGVHEVVPDLLAQPGLLAGKAAVPKLRQSLNTGVVAAQTLGQLDAGQAVVVIGSRIVALEGVEGTDAMLKRVAELKANGRLHNRKGGVLVKLAKPGQELRADLPTIGLSTVENAHNAQLEGIAVSASCSLIVDFLSVKYACEKHGLFLMGLEPEENLHG